jgi:hypothetical protein
MSDHPDFYADGVAISLGPFGITVTFQRSEPSVEAGAHLDPNVIVGRVRMSPALARVVGQGLLDAAAQQPPLASTHTGVPDGQKH